jgi:hypothetical protein
MARKKSPIPTLSAHLVVTAMTLASATQRLSAAALEIVSRAAAAKNRSLMLAPSYRFE